MQRDGYLNRIHLMHHILYSYKDDMHDQHDLYDLDNMHNLYVIPDLHHMYLYEGFYDCTWKLAIV